VLRRCGGPLESGCAGASRTARARRRSSSTAAAFARTASEVPLDDAEPILQRLYDNDDCDAFQEMWGIATDLADQYFASGCDPIN
jgi:hypothetical protein